MNEKNLPQRISRGTTVSMTLPEGWKVGRINLDRETFQRNMAERQEEQRKEEEVQSHVDLSFDGFRAAIALFKFEEKPEPYLEYPCATIENATSFTVYTPSCMTEEVQQAIEKALRPFQTI